MLWHPQLVMIGKVALAALLGAIAGFDREVKLRPAGLRTHMLVAAGCALLTCLGNPLLQNIGVSGMESRPDPLRVLEAVVTGVAFVGAGVIVARGPSALPHGITTAASLLVTAALGVAVALEQYVVAGGVALLMVLILTLVGAVTDRYVPAPDEDDL